MKIGDLLLIIRMRNSHKYTSPRTKKKRRSDYTTYSREKRNKAIEERRDTKKYIHLPCHISGVERSKLNTLCVCVCVLCYIRYVFSL